MINSFSRGLAVLALLLCSFAVVGQESPPEQPEAPVEPEPQDIENVIATLEDPQAREELVRELKVLLEAEQATAEEPGLAFEGRDLVATLRNLLTESWDAVMAIDPQQLVLSLAVSLLIILGALLVRWVIGRLLKRLYVRLAATGPAPPEDVIEIADLEDEEAQAADPARRRLPSGVTRLVNLVIGVVAVALIAESWGAGVGELLRTDLGSRVAEAGLAIGVILVITSVAWHVAGLVVARVLVLAAGGGSHERKARRVDALVPLLRSVLQMIIGVLAGLLILSELGVNIAPLLAGAGILGLAVGFGAQTLVKDLITGVTLLLEDAATVGDVVEAAGHVGVVEEMRVRIMQLRDLAGAVHLIPYSEVTTIVNHTQDFSFYLMEVGVAYREDTDEVCGVLNEVADELRGDPEFRSDILEPLEILGVDKFADSAVIIKVRLKTKPGRQWATGRAFNRRMKQVFDERGIEIPFPHTTLYFGEPKEGPAPPARVAITDQAQ